MNDSGGHVRVGTAAPESARAGLVDHRPRPGDGDSADPDPAFSALAEHTAVRLHGLGTSSGALASFIECFGSYAQSRVLGTGHEQYAALGFEVGPQQKYENDSLADLVDGALEELADLVNYSSMAAIKLLSVRRRFIS